MSQRCSVLGHVAHQEVLRSDARPEAVARAVALSSPLHAEELPRAGRCCVLAPCPVGASGVGPSCSHGQTGQGLQGIALCQLFGKDRGR